MNSPAATSDASIKRNSIPTWYIIVMIIAALVAAYFSEMVTNANKERFFTATGLPPFPPELLRKVMWDNIYNHSICFGFLGSILVGLYAMVTGCVVSPARGIVGFIVGSTLGLVIGAGAGVMGYFISDSLQTLRWESILKAMIIFMPVWSLLGVTATVVCTILAGRAKLIGKAIGMAIAMAMLTGIAYPMFVTFAFPSDWPGLIIPEFARSRLACVVIGNLCIVAAILLTFQQPKNQVAEAIPDGN